MKAHPYLNFNGNTEEAFNFYKSVFGGEFETLQRFSDLPPGQPGPDPAQMTPEAANRVMHVSLPLGPDLTLMGSDIPSGMDGAHAPGNNISISLAPDSLAEAERLYHELSQGGQVTMEFQKMFWGDHFGSFIDKFAIPWMVNYGEVE